ncbi:MAG: hypothetical protein HYV60_22980 [Planctomycetia bacterium]|nr:hypothetical protein [Planctomycetia bacterium]
MHLPELYTFYEYDSAHDLRTLTHPDGTTEKWTYSPKLHLVNSHTDQLNRTATYRLDGRGNPWLQTEPGSSYNPTRYTAFTYTPAPADISQLSGGLVSGTTVAYWSSDAVTTQTAYFTTGVKIGLPQTVTYAFGTTEQASVQYDYDGYRHRSSLKDELLRETVWTFDALGRLRFVIQPDPGTGDHGQPVTEFLYDTMSNQVAAIDAKGNRTDYVYDEMNRRSQKILPSPGGAPDTDVTRPVTTYAYDAAGHLTQTIDPYGYTITSLYDERNQKTYVIAPPPANGDTTMVLTYAYDAHGNLKGVRDAKSNASGDEYWTKYLYDNMGRLASTTDPIPETGDHGARSTYRVFDAVGQLKKLQTPSPNGGLVETQFEYDGLGRLVVETQINPGTGVAANVIATTYDRRDNVIKKTNSLGQFTEYEFDRRNRLVFATPIDPSPYADVMETFNEYSDSGELLSQAIVVNGVVDSARRTTNVCDNLGRLIRTTGTDPDGSGPQLPQLMEFHYDANGNPTAQVAVVAATDQRVSETYYDALNRPYVEYGPLRGDGTRPEFWHTYDRAGREIRTKQLQDDGVSTYYVVTDFVYDSAGRLRQTLGPMNAAGARPTTTSGYDANGNVTFVTTQLTGTHSSTRQHVYDRLNREIQTIYPGTVQHSSHSTLTRYNPDNSVYTSTQYAGTSQQRTSTYVRDNLSRTLEMHLPAVAGSTSILKQQYDVIGRVNSTTDPEENTTAYQYDAWNRSTHINRPIASTSTEHRYDTYGNLSKSIDFYGETRYGYDYSGRQVSQRRYDSTGVALEPGSTKEYDRLGQLIAVTNGESERTEYAYTTLGQREHISYPNGESVHFTYDLLGRQTSVRDGEGNVTVYGYDDTGNVTSETVMLNGVTYATAYQYDVGGRMYRMVDRNGHVRRVDYDTYGRPIGETWYESATDESAGVVAYWATTIYNVTGDASGFDDPASSYSLLYDDLGRVTEVIASNVGVPIVTLQNQYVDNSGVVRKDGLRYGLIGYIASVEDFQNWYTYDANRRTDMITQTGSGLAFPIIEKFVDFDWDAADRPDSIARFENGSSVATTNYGFDNLHRLTTLIHVAGGGTQLAGYSWTHDDADRVQVFDSASDGVVDYGYDDNGQLVAADYASYGAFQTDETYAYDDNGNRLSHAIGDHNRVVFDGVFNYTYDAEGNRKTRTHTVTGKVTTYTWDVLNRLINITELASASGSVTSSVDYTYDVFGRRISKQFDDDGDGVQDRAEHYIYDGDNIVMQFDASGDLTHRYLHGPSVDQILADETIDLAGTNDILWPLSDNFGTVRDLADYDPIADATTVANHLTYDAFGNITSETNAAIDHIFAYTGRERDKESDLYYWVRCR